MPPELCSDGVNTSVLRPGIATLPVFSEAFGTSGVCTGISREISDAVPISGAADILVPSIGPVLCNAVNANKVSNVQW
jgi:hypothetical protein